MLQYIRRKIKRAREKNTFKVYGTKIKNFTLDNEGQVQYAQWQHPLEGDKVITQSHVNFYSKFLHKGDLAIDIGAHTGDTTIPMALAAGREGLVIALEPNRFVFEVLKKNASLNPDKTNIKAECYAATAAEGKFTFNYSDASFCNGGYLSKIKDQRHKHNYELEVKGINLEQYSKDISPEILNKLSLIKIDAEGYDKEILKSIPNLLNRYRPYLITECLKKLTKDERIELFETIVSNGYKPHFIEDFEENTKIIPLKKEDMNNWKHFDILGIPEEKAGKGSLASFN